MKWLERFWDWIDQRDIDKHAVCWATFYGLIRITEWAMHFGWESVRPGLEVAAIITAVTAPYMALMGAVTNYYFKARTTT